MKSILIAGVILMPLGLMSGAFAAPPCDGTVTEIGTGPVIIYVDDRDYLNGDGLWIYMESNGQPGLQRGGQSIILGAADQEFPECQSANPDTLIF